LVLIDREEWALRKGVPMGPTTDSPSGLGHANPAKWHRELRSHRGTEAFDKGRYKEGTLLFYIFIDPPCILHLSPSHSLYDLSTTLTKMAFDVAPAESVHTDSVQTDSPVHEKNEEVNHLENGITPASNLVYEDDEEPELHARTYFALAAMFFLNLVQVFALQGPPAVVSGESDLDLKYIDD
jgi:hypothetical protein